MESIGSNAFQECTKVESIYIGKGVTNIGVDAFGNCTGEITINCDLSSMKLNKSIASITSIVLGRNVKMIGEYIFDGCVNLVSIIIPDSVTSIGNSAFYDCRKLKSVTIGSSVSSIGDDAFEKCYNLETLYCKPIVPPHLNANLVSNEDTIIYVPTGSLAAYKTAEYWNRHEHNIEGFDFN